MIGEVLTRSTPEGSADYSYEILMVLESAGGCCEYINNVLESLEGCGEDICTFF